MELPASFWSNYIYQLREVNDAAADKIRKYIEKYRVPQTREELDLFIDFAYGVTAEFGDAAAELAAQMYDDVARLSKVRVPPAVPAPTPDISEVAKTVVGTAKTGNEEIISEAVGRLVKKAGVNTTLQNAIRDHAQYAWIPHGDTCAFCIMLASNGWMSGGAGLENGQAAHIHANCDCTYGVRFDTSSGVKGYDPAKYREMYDDADGSNWHQKLNSMRRDFYAENAEEINEQKRDAYEKRKERESSAAEEMNV